MTLGRTTSGAIKIKTDGGLRAVECACCGGGDCSIFNNGPCTDYYAATEAEYLAWRRGGTLDFSISFSPQGASSSISDSGSIIVPPNSCLVGWDNGGILTGNYLSFSYGFLVKATGGYALSYISSAEVESGSYAQLMLPVSDFGDGCLCATPSAGPFPPETFVSGRGYCPFFFFNTKDMIVANITFTPNP